MISPSGEATSSVRGGKGVEVGGGGSVGVVVSVGGKGSGVAVSGGLTEKVLQATRMKLKLTRLMNLRVIAVIFFIEWIS